MINNKKTIFKLSKKEITVMLIFGLILISIPILFTCSKISFISFKDTGSIGDTIGGITAPFLSFFGSILVYMALKAQINANIIITNQFDLQKFDEANDFMFANYKERINLIISEVNLFSISFHDNTLITSIKDIPNSQGKKYNFIGIQAINLYLIEYFRQKKEHEKNSTKDFKFENSFHATFLNITNLIGLFYRTHKQIADCSLSNNHKNELEELLKYTYYAKFTYFFEILRIQSIDQPVQKIIEELYEYYKI